MLIETQELVRNYESFSLGPIDLALAEGTAMGLVGANGAGKTTLFRTLMGTLRKAQGCVRIAGEETNESDGSWRQLVGYVGDYSPMVQDSSGERNLAILKPFFPNWSDGLARELASRLQLDLSQKVKSLSTGQRTKLAIVIALARQPKLLLLDEPTSGLDPVARDIFMEILFEKMESSELGILYATHYVSEIEQIADEICFISEGRIVSTEIKDDLMQQWRRITFRYEKELPPLPAVIKLRQEGYVCEIITSKHLELRQQLENIPVESIEVSRLSIEQISVHILRNTLGL